MSTVTNKIGLGLFAVLAGVLCSACAGPTTDENWPPPVREIEDAPVLAPEEALRTMVLPPEFRIELVAAEPLVEDPVAVEVDPDGRLWVVEMRGFMTDLVDSEGDYQPVGRVSVLHDSNNDGRMDDKTVFLDSLVLPRSILVLNDGVLVGEPPHLWLARDTNSDLQADEKVVVRDDYGSAKGNPEGMANSPVWGMDNWIHNTRYPWRLRHTDSTWQSERTLRLGDWGLSMDNYGRFYRNWNSDPLRVALLDPHYYRRNPNLPREGAADVRIAREAQEVWPIRTTRGVNRGYRESTLRENGTLRTVTAAGSPVVYRGDRYPDSFQGDVFITEPAGNLVRRFEIIERGDGTMKAVNPYEQAEFLASTDERFRPVNLYSGPDGTLYVVDMYRGVIEHRNFMTQYLKNHVVDRGLQTPLGLGRIYRVVHSSTSPRREKPQLGSASGKQLIDYLRHPNGWWRDTAQQLLVEQHHTAVVPQLREMVRSGESELTRLHALWTLEGLRTVDVETVRRGLHDQSSQVRAAAVRVFEPFLREGSPDHLSEVTHLVRDPAPEVRLQLAASLGEVPPPAADSLLAVLLTHHPTQPHLVEAAATGLKGRETQFLERLVQMEGWREEGNGRARALRLLATTTANSGDVGRIDDLLQLTGDDAGLLQWQRLALLAGLEEVVPEPSPGIERSLRLDREPAFLSRLVQVSDVEVREKARSIAARITWPGKPGYRAGDEHVLTPMEKKRYQEGKDLYEQTCATCHQSNGQGRDGVAASLVGSQWVVGREKNVVRIILDGKEGTAELMPAHRSRLSDREVAAVATYVRNAWENEGSPVDSSTVADVRKATALRGRPWTEEELDVMLH